MTTLHLVGGGVLVAVVVAGMLLFRLAQAAEAAAKADARAEKAEADAFTQKEYAKIATQQHNIDTTAGVLDDGKFFMPSASRVLPRGTGESGSRDTGEA